MTFKFKLCFIALFLGGTLARVYETRDAIIVEAGEIDTDRLGRMTGGDEANDGAGTAKNIDGTFEYAFPEPLSVLHNALPSGTFYIGDRTCWTADGRLGTCGSFRSCYPKEKLPTGEDDLVAWISTRGTCQYREESGKQAFGVCCARDDVPQSSGFPMYPFMMPISLSNQWWPSQFYPFAPSPVNFAPSPINFAPYPGQKPPSVSAPSPPWLVPVQQITTPRPSTTTSPWWTSEQTTTKRPATTTSPWWTPESTTQKPTTTTSPWWTPEATKPPTTKPTTTETTTKKETPTSTTTKPTTPTTTTTAKPSSVKPETQPVVGNADIPCGAGPYKTLSIDEQRRIVGGTNAPKNAWPFIVALFNGGRHFCGGSLIDEDHVLTAAHCVAHMSSSDVARLTIAVGMHSLKPADPDAIRLKVKRIVRHKGFDSRTLYNDVAVIQLERPVQFGPTASAVCLPSTGNQEKFVGRSAAVIGWGALREGGPQPSVLQQVTVQVQSNDECKRRYGEEAPGGIVDHMLCAAYPGKDSCSGDSGGPLVVQKAPGSPWTLAGIVSWGIGCGKPPYPGVYARVTSFLDWINRNRA